MTISDIREWCIHFGSAWFELGLMVYGYVSRKIVKDSIIFSENSYSDRIMIFSELSIDLRRNYCARGLYNDQLGSDKLFSAGYSVVWFLYCNLRV